MGNTITQCCPCLAGAMDSPSDTSSLTTLHPCPGPNHAPVEAREACATCILSQTLFLWIIHALRLQFLSEGSLARELIYENCYWKVREEGWDGVGSIYYYTGPPTKARVVGLVGAEDPMKPNPKGKEKSKASIEVASKPNGLDEFRKFLAEGGVKKWVEKEVKWRTDARLGDGGGWGIVDGFPIEIVGRSAQRERARSPMPVLGLQVGSSSGRTAQGGYTRWKVPGALVNGGAAGGHRSEEAVGRRDRDVGQGRGGTKGKGGRNLTMPRLDQISEKEGKGTEMENLSVK